MTIKKKPAATKPTDSFTSTEVGVLIEKLQSEFHVFGEGLTSLRSDVESLKTDMGTVKSDLSLLKVDVAVLKVDAGTLKFAVTQIMTDVKEIKAAVCNHGRRLVKLEETCTK